MSSLGPDPRDYRCMAGSVPTCDGGMTGYTRRDLENDLGWVFRPIKKLNGRVGTFDMCGKCETYWQGLWAFKEET